MIFLLTLGLAHASVDRIANVTGAYRMLPVVLDLLRDKVATRDRAVYERVRKTIARKKTLLTFVTQPEHFDLGGGEDNRLMMTTVNTDGQIDVNVALLNADETRVDTPYLLKTLFHEYARKIGLPIAEGDRVAQWLEDQTRPFSRRFANVETFSVPASAVDENLHDLGSEVPQPTNLVLVEENNRVRDVTTTVLAAIAKAAPVLRTLWHEVNRFPLAMMAMSEGMIHAMFEREMSRLVAQGQLSFAHAAEFRANFKNAFKVGVDELRVLEIQDVEFLGKGVRVKAAWVTSRSGRRRFPFTFDGPSPPPEEFAVPVTLTGDLDHLTAIVRPSLDLEQTAEVRDVQHAENGTTIGLRLPPTTEAFLSVQTKHGLRLVPALYNSGGLAVFRLPPDFEGGARVYAEAVQLGSHQTIYLDRLVEAGHVDDHRPITPNRIEAAGVALFDKGVEGFRSEFDYAEPIFAAPGLTIVELPYVDAVHVPIALRLAHPAHVVEVRLHLKRLAIVGDRTGEEEVFWVPWGDKERPVGMPAGQFSQMPNYFEIVTSTPDRIRTFPDGSVRASLTLPFVGPPLVKSDDIYMLPSITPIALEVVLEDGQILSHPLGKMAEPGACAFELKGKFWGQSQMHVTR